MNAKRSTGCLLALLCLFCGAPSALAHAGLAKTVPDHDAVLDHAPSELSFSFMARVTLTNIRLEISDGPDAGKRIELRLPRDNRGKSTAIGEHIALPLPALKPAAYHVVWRAVARDGQALIDEFSFRLQAPESRP